MTAERGGFSAGNRNSRRIGEVKRYRRLREAFVSLASSHAGRVQTYQEQQRCRDLTTALIEQSTTTTQTWTESLCRLVISVLPSANGSAVTTYDRLGTAHPAAACDDRSLALEQLQQVVGEGPGYAAQTGGQPIVVENIASQDTHWPVYVGLLNGQQVGAIWAFPITIEGMAVASITIYHKPGSFPRYRSWSDAAILAGLGAATIVIDADLLTERGPAAQHPPNLVDIATGVLAVRAGVGVDEALALLRGRSFSSGRRISEVASDVLAGSVELSCVGRACNDAAGRSPYWR